MTAERLEEHGTNVYSQLNDHWSSPEADSMRCGRGMSIMYKMPVNENCREERVRNAAAYAKIRNRSSQRSVKGYGNWSRE